MEGVLQIIIYTQKDIDIKYVVITDNSGTGQQISYSRLSIFSFSCGYIKFGYEYRTADAIKHHY